MYLDFSILKGINPVRIIIRDLRKLGISQADFCCALGEDFFLFENLLSGEKKFTDSLSLKIEKLIGYEKYSLLRLKKHYYNNESKLRAEAKTIKGAPKIRKILFWDTDFDSMDWIKYKKSVIERVNERGNKEEKLEIARFYSLL